MQLTDFSVPNSQAARAALEVATEYLSESLVNHSIRSWYWAVGFAAIEERQSFDAELLYVSAILHDVGLATEFDNHTLAYEDAGGHLAGALTAGAGWEKTRRVRAHEVIVRHNWPEVDPNEDVEGYLLEIATGLDIAGRRPDALPEDFQREVLATLPRLDLATDFGSCVADQADRKPTTAAARLVAGGLLRKLAENPLESRAN
jgi:hypothetical protein